MYMFSIIIVLGKSKYWICMYLIQVFVFSFRYSQRKDKQTYKLKSSEYSF